MKKLVASLLVVVLALVASPINVLGIAQNNGEISGTAEIDGKPVAQGTKVRLRNTDTNTIVNTTTTGPAGEFRFTGLNAGNFVVEILGDDDRVITTYKVGLTAGAMIAAGLLVNTGAAAAAAGGLAVGGAVVGAAAGISTTAIVAGTVLAGLSAAAVVAVTNDASASGG